MLPHKRRRLTTWLLNRFADTMLPRMLTHKRSRALIGIRLAFQLLHVILDCYLTLTLIQSKPSLTQYKGFQILSICVDNYIWFEKKYYHINLTLDIFEEKHTKSLLACMAECWTMWISVVTGSITVT